MSPSESKTFSAEASMPRVPLPRLEDSCARFLDWCAPLLTPAELATTEAAVQAFLAPDSPAHGLHEALVRYDARPDVQSWLDDFWRDRYLGRRVRTAINANFFFLFKDGETDQFRRAADLVMAALAHKDAVDSGRMPWTVQRGAPLSMQGHKYLFSSARLPGVEKDTVRTPYSTAFPGPSKETHIVVFVQGHIFRLDVIGADGRPHSLDELTAALADISRSVTTRGQGVGSLTSLDRPDWARQRDRLRGLDPANARTVDIIESAIVGLALEPVPPADTLDLCQTLLTGDSGNRWFDLAITFIVFPGGRSGLNGEHTYLDGTVIAEFIAAMMAVPPAGHATTLGARPQGKPACTELTFHLDDELKAAIGQAGTAFDACAASTSGQLFEIEGYGSDRAKELKLSPDAFIQLVYQLAHQRAKGFVGATYESISNRRYRFGRTEAMRVVTPEVIGFVAAMEDPGRTDVERGRAAREAAARHVARARECQASEAPEQHLWELDMIQQRQGGGPRLALYESPGWRIMRDDYLSTSSVPSVVDALGFGATSGHCIGIAYQFLPDRTRAYLSTPTLQQEGMAHFVDTLPGAMTDLARVLEATLDNQETG